MAATKAKRTGVAASRHLVWTRGTSEQQFVLARRADGCLEIVLEVEVAGGGNCNCDDLRTVLSGLRCNLFAAAQEGLQAKFCGLGQLCKYYIRAIDC